MRESAKQTKVTTTSGSRLTGKESTGQVSSIAGS